MDKKLTIEITNDCSLNCIHCSTNAKKDSAYFMPFENFKEYLRDYREFDVMKLSGGEPFHHPEISLFLDHAKTIHKKKTEVLSCGNYHSSFVPFSILKECKPFLDRIMFSIYGNEENYNRTCRTKNARQNLEKTIQYCEDLNIPFKFETIAMPGVSLEEVFYYLNNLNSDKLSLKIMHLIPQGRAIDVKSFSQIQTDEFKKEAKNLGERFKVPIKFSCSLEEKCYADSGKKAIVIINNKPKIVNCSALKYSGRNCKNFS